MKEDKITLSKTQEILIEKLGIANEKNDIQPAAARIMSLLLVSDKTELTFEEIYNTLGISKSAASNAINVLLKTSKIDYITKIGDRKRYFRSNVIYWQENLKNDLGQLSQLVILLTEVLNNRSKKTKEFNEKLKEVIEFISFLNAEIPNIYSRWEKSKLKK